MGESRDISRVVADNDGVITIAQARACGLSPRQVDGRLRRGEWERLGRGVYLSSAHHFTDAARIRGAVALTGGTADAETALFWHGVIDVPPLPTTVSVPRTHHRAPRYLAPLDVHRRDLLPADIEVVRGVPVTRLPLSLFDSAPLRRDATTLLDRSLQSDGVTVSGLRAALDRNAGRRGMAEARRIVEVVEADTESVAERRFAALMTAEGISGWVAQLVIGRYRADFAWPREKLVVEVDGWAFHKDAVRFQADHDKRNALARLGMTILSFTWHDVVNEPVAVVESVVAVLSDRRAAVS
ncbi:DUF559 domain-containing protein [Tsukamurella ocularis]